MRIPLLQALSQRGFAVAAAGSEPGEVFERAGIRYHHYPLERDLDPLRDLQTRAALTSLFNHCRPDLVHGFDTKPAILAPLCARAAGVSGRVRTITGMGYVFSSESLLARSLRPVYRLLQKKASAASGMTIFQNVEDRQYFLDHNMVNDEGSTLVYGSGVNCDEFSRHPEDCDGCTRLRQELNLSGKKVVTMIARLVREKGVVEYLDAAQAVCRRDDVVFLLVGPQSSEGRMAVPMTEVEQRTGQQVRYLGVRRDIDELLGVTDVFVLPSYREGFSRVLLEAGAAGLPLVTTDVPGCRELVHEGVNGLLVPPGSAEGIRDAVLRLLEMSPAERQAMGRRSAEHVRTHFDLRIVADAYAEIYRMTLGRAPDKQRGVGG